MFSAKDLRDEVKLVSTLPRGFAASGQNGPATLPEPSGSLSGLGQAFEPDLPRLTALISSCASVSSAAVLLGDDGCSRDRTTLGMVVVVREVQQAVERVAARDQASGQTLGQTPGILHATLRQQGLCKSAQRDLLLPSFITWHRPCLDAICVHNAL